MPTPLHYEVPLPLSKFLERLHNETVSFEIFQEMLQTPGQGYAELLRESFSGLKNLMSKIDGNKFRQMNIGVWSFKEPTIS